MISDKITPLGPTYKQRRLTEMECHHLIEATLAQSRSSESDLSLRRFG
jgi:hypothetical protein